jgi:2-furoyl-CoA dehydrogenase large subunit
MRSSWDVVPGRSLSRGSAAHVDEQATGSRLAAVTTPTAESTWVGRALHRLEDEALLRGEGRFIDDLDPVANARHAAVLRSPFAHARITRLDPTPALELPGVIGVLTGADVVELSRPFPAGIDSPIPHYAAAHEVTRYVGEPVAVVVARDRYVAEDALELIEVEYEPLGPVLDAEAAVETEACVSDRSFHYGDIEAALAGADLVVRERFRFPRWSCTPIECYGVVADWSAAEGSLTAWANFQGPFTLHSVAAGALGLPGSKLRLITPPESGGSFGIKSAVVAYVVLMGLASRKLGVPVRWIEDRLEHLAASSSSSGRVTHVEAGFTSDGDLVALRYDAIEDVGAYVRAPEPATLYRMHGSLAGAYRAQNVAARNRVVLTNTMPSGLNRGFGGPQLYLALERTMTIAANRLGVDPAELRRRNLIRTDELPYRTPPGALYDSGDYEGCLDDALALARYDARRADAETARADGRLVGVGIACVVEPSISNMGYITLAEPGDERGLPKSGNAEGCSITISALGGITVHTATTPQGQGHRTVIAQVVADRLDVEPAAVDVLTEVDTATSPWTIASGNYSSRFSGVGVGAVAAAADRLAEKIAEIRAHLGDESASLRRVAGTVHWNPEALPAGMEPGLAVTAYYAAPNLLPPDGEDRIASSAAHGFVADVAVVEIDRDTGEVSVLDYITVHDAGRLLNPLLAEGQVRGGLAHGAAAALFERHVYDEDGNLLTGSFMDYLVPTAPDLPTPRIAHRESPSPFLPLGAKGLGEGTTMSVPAAIANAVADALGRDDVEPPFTPGRVWELLRS